MADVAEILARPNVIGAIRSLVRGALIDGGVTDPHATRIAISFAERVREGAPVVTAIALVEAILEQTTLEAENAELRRKLFSIGTNDADALASAWSRGASVCIDEEGMDYPATKAMQTIVADIHAKHAAPAPLPPKRETMATDARHDCEKSARPGFLTDGYRQDGERWTCPDCGKVWVHACDEAEGCSWVPAPRSRHA